MTLETVYEVLGALESVHHRRRDTYKQLAASSSDERARLLLNRLEELERIAVAEVHDEHGRLQPNHATYLPLGPGLTSNSSHGVDCQCGTEPSFDEALDCVLSSDGPLDELIDRLAGCSAAASVQDLAMRLRDLERTRDRQIANFARED